MKQGNPESRRYKILAIPGSALVAMLRKPRVTLDKHEKAICVNVWRFPDLPEDVSVRDVHWNWDTQCWDVIVEHASFPEVYQSETIPRLSMVSDPVLVSEVYVPRDRKPLL